MFYKYTLKPNEVISNIALVSFTNLTVKDASDLLVAQIQGQGEVILEKGDMYAFDKELTKMTLVNIHDREVTIEFWASNSAKYTDSKSTINGSIEVRSLAAIKAVTKGVEVTEDTVIRVLDGNTGRKSALFVNNSTSVIWLKSRDAIDFDNNAIPLMPGASLTINNVEPYFAKTQSDNNAGTTLVANMRIHEESY